jgi:hypothetical protein
MISTKTAKGEIANDILNSGVLYGRKAPWKCEGIYAGLLHSAGCFAGAGLNLLFLT